MGWAGRGGVLCRAPGAYAAPTPRWVPAQSPGSARTRALLREGPPETPPRHRNRVVDLGTGRNPVRLVRALPPHVGIPRLVQGVKGASAPIANHDGVMPRARLRWANGYDLRSLGVRDLRRAIEYVRAQSTRHPGLGVDEAPG